MKSRCLGIALVGFGLAAACDGRPRPTPTGPGSAQLPPPSPPLPPQPTEPRQSQAFEISGVVTDDVGTPVAGAKMTVLLDTYDIGAVVVTSPSATVPRQFQRRSRIKLLSGAGRIRHARLDRLPGG